MTISADVRAAWELAVWSDAEIEEPVITYPLPSTGLLEADVANLYFEERINFIQTVTKSIQQIGITGTSTTVVNVMVSYYKEIQVNDDSFNAVIDRLEEIRDLVAERLTLNWGGTVDFYQLQRAEPTVIDVTIGATRLWRGSEQYIGQKAGEYS